MSLDRLATRMMNVDAWGPIGAEDGADGICDETGALRPHLHLFINNDLLADRGFETRIEPNDVVSVFQAVSGG